MNVTEFDDYQGRGRKYDLLGGGGRGLTGAGGGMADGLGERRVGSGIASGLEGKKRVGGGLEKGASGGDDGVDLEGTSGGGEWDAQEVGLVEKVLGLAGEAGEVADKFKKIMRDEGGRITEGDREALKGELGDVLWYVAMVARYLDLPLSEVAEGNLEKLESRYVRGKIGGTGDNR